MQEDFRQRLLSGEKMDCPCCGRYAQVYQRRLHTSIALQLIELYKLGGTYDYIHASKLIPKGVSGAGDLSKAKYWGLISEKQPDGNQKSSGFWMLTDLGVQYVTDRAKVPYIAHVYNDTVLGFSSRLSGIREALSEKFDYQQLMEGI
jgi:hypothetical protein